MIFLVDYDRQSGTLIDLDEFRDDERPVAEQRRLKRELAYAAENVLEHELVILEAESREELQRTHRRYFMTLAELSGARES